MTRQISQILLLLTLAISPPTRATPLFDDDAVLSVEVVGPFGTLAQNTEQRDELPFILRSGDVEHEIKVRVRGKSRLHLCNFPPLQLNFRKDRTEGSVFAGQDKLKLVTPCHLSDRAEIDLLEEYAAYRIFNLLSDASFRVRLMHMRFVDSESRLPKVPAEYYAFVIEPSGHLAERVRGIESDLAEVALSWLDTEQLAIVFVFQFLIANTDWSLVRPLEEQACCHNGDLFDTDDKTLYVPYDFDLSGLVNAPYARRNPELRVRNVTFRRYRGFCIDPVPLRNAIRTVRSRQETVLDIISGLPVLTEDEKRKRAEYLMQFFDETENEDRLMRRFEKRCID
jgi:hypothetical protein